MITIDGETLRELYNHEDRASTIHTNSDYASSNKLILGQLKTDAEITIIPELIKMHDIKDSLVIMSNDILDIL